MTQAFSSEGEANKDSLSEDAIDEALEESFPASDPPQWTLGTNHHTETKEDGDDDSSD